MLIRTVNSKSFDQSASLNKPSDKSVYLKIIFLISEAKYMLWVLDETVLLSSQNTCYEGQSNITESWLISFYWVGSFG